MLPQSKATPAAAWPARRGLPYPLAVGALALLAGTILAACQPRTVALSGADPADPAARVAPVCTSEVTAPYASLRPAAPSAWGRPNDSVAPRSEPSR